MLERRSAVCRDAGNGCSFECESEIDDFVDFLKRVRSEFLPVAVPVRGC